ncbi:MAG: hypothetical protein MPF33_10105 [Candidatus Aramenus sp.]|nr:hypothetical protein [Candidatus Aramenus sp.]
MGFIIYRTLASHLTKTLWSLGVSTVYLGYPNFISRNKGNKLTSNLVLSQVGAIVNEYGIIAFLVVEYNTSRLYAFHNVQERIANSTS